MLERTVRNSASLPVFNKCLFSAFYNQVSFVACFYLFIYFFFSFFLNLVLYIF